MSSESGSSMGGPVGELGDDDVSASIAAEAGRLLVDLRERIGVPTDRAAADALRKEADRASHELIIARFAELRPHDAVLSEEGVDDLARLEAPRVWIVDPLDGTWEFGQGRSDFAVHIVLWTAQPDSPTGGRLSAGTVDLPAQGLVRRSVDADAGGRGLPEDRPVRLVASRSRPPAVLPRAVEILTERLASRGFDAGVEVIDVGSVGAKVNEILAGRADAYVHDTGFWEWDVAAPLSVARAHGLVAGHIDGADIRFNQERPYVTDLLVGIPTLADDVRAAMRQASGDVAE